MAGLFDELPEKEWEKEWKDMPEFSLKDLTPKQSIVVHFATDEDRKIFAKLVGQNITYKTQSIWYPAASITTYMDKGYFDESKNLEVVQNL
jgi:hypothetical protein